MYTISWHCNMQRLYLHYVRIGVADSAPYMHQRTSKSRELTATFSLAKPSSPYITTSLLPPLSILHNPLSRQSSKRPKPPLRDRNHMEPSHPLPSSLPEFMQKDMGAYVYLPSGLYQHCCALFGMICGENHSFVVSVDHGTADSQPFTSATLPQNPPSRYGTLLMGSWPSAAHPGMRNFPRLRILPLVKLFLKLSRS